ncbi:MAG: thiamine biosynthesis protein ThiI, partial [Paraglaciecola sp.]
MKFIIRLHPDIIVKSRRVRKRFTRLLEGNIRLVFERNHLSVEVNSAWDKILLLVAPLAQGKQAEIIELLQRILGIDQIFLV